MIVWANSETFIASIALIFSVGSFCISFRLSHSLKKENLTIEIWKTWASADYRRFRLTASRRIKGELEHLPPPLDRKSYRMLAEKAEDELAIASIQHIITDMARVYDLNLVDKKLFETLFKSTLEDWRKTFEVIVYDFTPGKDIKQELDTSFKTLLDKINVNT